MQSDRWCYNVQFPTSSVTYAQSGHIFQHLPWRSYSKIRTSWCINPPLSVSFSHEKVRRRSRFLRDVRLPIGIEVPDKGCINRPLPWRPQRQRQGRKTVHFIVLKVWTKIARIGQIKLIEYHNPTELSKALAADELTFIISLLGWYFVSADPSRRVVE